MKRSLYKRNSAVIARRVENKIMILHPLEGKLHTCNLVGTYIWRILWKSQTIESIADKVTKKFEVNKKESRKDVEVFLKKAIKDKLIVLSSVSGKC